MRRMLTGLVRETRSGRCLLLCSSLLILVHCLGFSTAMAADSCRKAEALFQQSMATADPSAQQALLQGAVALCPGHALAWNNLGSLLEARGDLQEAERAYREATTRQPDLAVPYAGLGDVAMALGLYRAAVEAYGRFLELLSEEISSGDPQGLAPYEEEYREKHQDAKLKWQIHQASLSGVVPTTTLTRGFRGIGVKKKIRAKPAPPTSLALSILFDFGSAALRERGRQQLMAVAGSILSPELAGSRFAIEGHTDTIGPPESNLALGQNRAESVMRFLGSQGVPRQRLVARSYGETRPIIPHGTPEVQALNRRVEFVRLDR